MGIGAQDILICLRKCEHEDLCFIKLKLFGKEVRNRDTEKCLSRGPVSRVSCVNESKA